MISICGSNRRQVDVVDVSVGGIVLAQFIRDRSRSRNVTRQSQHDAGQHQSRPVAAHRHCRHGLASGLGGVPHQRFRPRVQNRGPGDDFIDLSPARHFNCLAVGLSRLAQLAGRSLRIGDRLQHVVFVRFAFGPVHLALHGCRVAFKISDDVQVRMVEDRVEVGRDLFLPHRLGFRKAVQSHDSPRPRFGSSEPR